MSGLINIDRDFCLSFSYRKLTCRRCVDACPTGALKADLSFAPQNCDECGLCLAACPADAMGGGGYSPRALASLFDKSDLPVTLACPKREEFSQWPCLGFIDSRLLLALVSSGAGSGRRVAIDDRDCAACRPAVAAHIEAVVTEANRLLGMAIKPLVERGEVVATIKQPETPISRRAFFAELLGATVNTVREVVAAGDGGGRFTSRELSAKYSLDSLAAITPPSTVYNNIVIGEGCQACGLCAKLCPRKAIAITDKVTSFDFDHDPIKCDGCGVCAAHCPNEAIHLEAAGRLDVHHVAARSLPRCEGCGQIYQPVARQPLCLECMLKSRSRIT